ncbi:G-D-S-L family lipolytic protein [Algibacter sp. L4_22]|uniref:G-D-S-L family lipolytic protein n=1 Tax=Algibacter sp. L4_22 TaxID=2942477 RepID=UPI00201B94EA|nr:G-D-S-L family lipolytic protein [Algibacter sp. L4_22]MCL5127404.1 G-D-S-L family lipolytic protein [Algibacter sp. L4_22]
MKNTIINSKYILVLSALIGFTSCNEIDDVSREEAAEVLPELVSGSADFTNYVSLGASFTAGYTDGALFIAGQNNSFPNLLANQFASLGGGDFTQPLTDDNFGGLAAGGTRIAEPRLVFGGSTPVPLESLVGPVTVSTDIVLNNPTGPFSNLGVPGAKSFHLLSDSYGNIAGVGSYANPYFVRMASSPSATILGDAMAQSPTFFTLSEMGANDVLSFAVSGGSGVDQQGNLDPSTYGSNDITDPNVFANVLSGLVATLTSGGAKGVVTNVPYITDLPHFTTVPYNPIPLDAATAGYLNSAAAYGAYNAGIVQGFAYLVGNGLMAQVDADTEIIKRTIQFSESATNAVVIMDEDLTDLTAINPALVSMRQATAEDLLVLSASSFIGTEAVPGNPLSVNGVAVPLADKWVLTPEEQLAIKDATDAYNVTIKAVSDANDNIALVDLNTILSELATTGISFGNYTLKANLVTGGAVSLDGIHLTGRGYSYMAYKFLEAIDDSFGANFIASGNVPNPGDYPTNYSPTLQ